MQLRHAKSDCWKARRRQTRGKKSQLSKLNASRRQDKENQPPVSSQSQTSSLHDGITDRISPLHRQLDEINALSHTYERRRVICRGKITSAAAAEPFGRSHVRLVCSYTFCSVDQLRTKPSTALVTTA